MSRLQRIGAGAVVALVAALLLAGSVAAVYALRSFPQLDGALRAFSSGAHGRLPHESS